MTSDLNFCRTGSEWGKFAPTLTPYEYRKQATMNREIRGMTRIELLLLRPLRVFRGSLNSNTARRTYVILRLVFLYTRISITLPRGLPVLFIYQSLET